MIEGGREVRPTVQTLDVIQFAVKCKGAVSLKGRRSLERLQLQFLIEAIQAGAMHDTILMQQMHRVLPPRPAVKLSMREPLLDLHAPELRAEERLVDDLRGPEGREVVEARDEDDAFAAPDGVVPRFDFVRPEEAAWVVLAVVERAFDVDAACWRGEGGEEEGPVPAGAVLTVEEHGVERAGFQRDDGHLLVDPGLGK